MRNSRRKKQVRVLRVYRQQIGILCFVPFLICFTILSFSRDNGSISDLLSAAVVLSLALCLVGSHLLYD